MCELFNSLKDKQSLEILDIRDNYINDEAVDEFCVFLSGAFNLKKLNVSDCNIKPKDNEKIVDSLCVT